MMAKLNFQRPLLRFSYDQIILQKCWLWWEYDALFIYYFFLILETVLTIINVEMLWKRYIFSEFFDEQKVQKNNALKYNFL